MRGQLLGFIPGAGEFPLQLLHLRYVGELDGEAGDDPVLDVGVVRREAVTEGSIGDLNLHFKALGLPGQGGLDVRQVALEQRTEDLPHVGADHLLAGAAEPGFIGRVGEAAAQVAIPVAQERVDVIDDFESDGLGTLLFGHRHTSLRLKRLHGTLPVQGCECKRNEGRLALTNCPSPTPGLGCRTSPGRRRSWRLLEGCGSLGRFPSAGEFLRMVERGGRLPRAGGFPYPERKRYAETRGFDRVEVAMRAGRGVDPVGCCGDPWTGLGRAGADAPGGSPEPRRGTGPGARGV